ncbi:MAG: hypothetical protein WA775_06700 [Psychroserpens sp.]|uniref:hypothetical protein n=1 Tax=Psychroserpens sp. TaxID=2020870 RepID=UPI003CC20087
MNLKIIFAAVIFVIGFSTQAQTVVKDGKTYEVKKDAIFIDGQDVTADLSTDNKVSILDSARLINEATVLKQQAEKEAKQLEKERVKAEKALKKAEKEQKRAEKALKKKEKAQEHFEKTNKKLNDAKKKYKKLLKKGKLSPNDQEKWLEKIEDLKEDLEKAQNKM